MVPINNPYINELKGYLEGGTADSLKKLSQKQIGEHLTELNRVLAELQAHENGTGEKAAAEIVDLKKLRETVFGLAGEALKSQFAETVDSLRRSGQISDADLQIVSSAITTETSNRLPAAFEPKYNSIAYVPSAAVTTTDKPEQQPQVTNLRSASDKAPSFAEFRNANDPNGQRSTVGVWFSWVGNLFSGFKKSKESKGGFLGKIFSFFNFSKKAAEEKPAEVKKAEEVKPAEASTTTTPEAAAATTTTETQKPAEEQATDAGKQAESTPSNAPAQAEPKATIEPPPPAARPEGARTPASISEGTDPFEKTEAPKTELESFQQFLTGKEVEFGGHKIHLARAGESHFIDIDEKKYSATIKYLTVPLPATGDLFFTEMKGWSTKIESGKLVATHTDGTIRTYLESDIKNFVKQVVTFHEGTNPTLSVDLDYSDQKKKRKSLFDGTVVDYTETGKLEFVITRN